MQVLIISVLLVFLISKNAFGHLEKENSKCSTLVSKEIFDEIKSHQGIVNEIIHSVTNGTFKGEAYADLENFVDKFGSRLTGSDALERAIDFMLNKMETIGLQNVHAENVTAPKWVRGRESLTLMTPYAKTIPMLGLAFSAQTPRNGITAEVIVVNSFAELWNSTKNMTGKIVVFNQPFENPEKAIKYRQFGAIEAAKRDAVAVIVRSYATFSLGTPHTGLMFYNESISKIPAAEISIEDAQLLHRLYKKGEKVVVHLKIENAQLGEFVTRNSIGDLRGISKPDEFVLISGHMDSWDVGQGALDDGYGVIISVKAQELLRALNLTTQRTVRTILWTAEEIGEVPFGAAQYVNAHRAELDNYTMFLEADSGVLGAHGLIFTGSESAGCIVSAILKLLEPNLISKTKLYPEFPRLKTDIVPLMHAVPVPGALIATQFDKYFWYHHSQADTIEAIDPHDLDVCLAMWTALSYVLGNLSVMLPR